MVYSALTGLAYFCGDPGRRFALPWAGMGRPFGAFVGGDEHDDRITLRDIDALCERFAFWEFLSHVDALHRADARDRP